MSTTHLTVESSQGTQSLPLIATDRELRLADLLRRKHLPLNTRCGQRGLCDGCLVDVIDGTLIHVASGATAGANNTCVTVRACEHRLTPTGDVRLRIPPRSLLAYEPQVVSDFKTNVPRAHDPLWQQVTIPPAGVTAIQRRRPVRISDRLKAGHRTSDSPFGAPPLGGIRPDPTRTDLATLEYHGDHWLVTEINATSDPLPIGVAIDIGTTTVAVLVTDLRDGTILGGAANFNRQMHLGDDVLTRINLCSTDATMLLHLQQLVVNETIAPLLTEALQKANATDDQVRCITVAANTTMLHLFVGTDPSSMGIAPFTPAFLEHRIVTAQSIGLPYRATIHLLPGAAAYVGADLTAGAFATGLVYDDGPSLLVDVGTNGEIILKHGDKLYGCATAAGPAFEGAGLKNGVRAVDGAIAHISLSRDSLRAKTEKIGTGKPIGLCGTAYVDFLAEARRIELISPAGRFDPALVPDGAFTVAKDVVVTGHDIANLLQAKAAIAAGILTLLERRGLQPADVRKLYLAGGFGLHLNRANAIACGLLPGFVPDQIEVVGNSSLAGAYLSLLDCGALDEICRVGQNIEVVELNLDPQFEDRYIDQLSLM